MSEQLKHIPEDIGGLRQPNIDVPELYVIEQGEQATEEKELVERISQIRGLPHEHLSNQQFLFAWLDRQRGVRFAQKIDNNLDMFEYKEPAGKDILDEKSTEELTNFLLENLDNFDIAEVGEMGREGVNLLVQNIAEGRDSQLHPKQIATIGLWLEKFQGKERHGLIINIEKQVAPLLQNHGDLSLSIVALLGEIEQHKVAYFIEDELVDILETKSGPSRALLDQLSVLIRLNHPTGNVLLHKIIDFFQDHLETLQNYTPEQEADKPWAHSDSEGRRLISASGNFDEFVQAEILHSKNYLIRKHLQDYFETVHAFGRAWAKSKSGRTATSCCSSSPVRPRRTGPPAAGRHSKNRPQARTASGRFFLFHCVISGREIILADEYFFERCQGI